MVKAVLHAAFDWSEDQIIQIRTLRPKNKTKLKTDPGSSGTGTSGTLRDHRARLLGLLPAAEGSTLL